MLVGDLRGSLEIGPNGAREGGFKGGERQKQAGVEGADRDGWAGSDRRRWQRRGSEQLLARSRFLPPDDRALVEAVFRDGTPVTRLAAATGQRSARTLRRRLRHIMARATSPRFDLLARLIIAGDVGRWPRNRRRVAEKLYLEGRTLRRAALELGISVHVVRSHRAAIEAIFEGAAG